MNGWEPREFTELIYEGDRVVGHVTTREPEFNASDVSLMLAHQLIEDDRGPHGHLMSEATDPLANPALLEGWRYEANATPIVDYAAQAIARSQKAFYDNPKYKDMPRDGHIWHAKKVGG